MNRIGIARVQYHAVRWVWVLGLALLTQIAFPSSATDYAPLLDVGDRAAREIKAPFDFVVSKTDDEVRRESEEDAASALPIWVVNQRVSDSALAQLHVLFASLDTASRHGASAVTRAAAAGGLTLSSSEAEYLTRSPKRHAQLAALEALLPQTLGQGVASAVSLRAEPSRQLIVRRGPNEYGVDKSQVLTAEGYLGRARGLHPDPGSSVGDLVYLKLVRRSFRITLTRDDLATTRRRNELIAGVDRTKFAVRQGDRLIGQGEVVTEAVAEKLTALHAELVRRGSVSSATVGGWIGPIIRNGLIICVFWVLMLFYRRETYREPGQVGLVAALFAAAITGGALVAHWVPDHPELIPLPFTAMMMTVLFNGRVSMIGAMILTALIATQPVFHDTPVLLLCWAGGVTAALSVKSLRRRTQLYSAVVLVGLGYAAAALAEGMSADWAVQEIGLRAAFGVANGLVSAALTILVLPVAERLTHVTTDLSLLELSDPSRPLLRRLSIEAPGTYAHSIAMANLVESACNRIGANGILGRVGCYYHDVGKLANPQYFAENQVSGVNPHDRLTTAQSVAIIRAHVPEGIRLAQEAGLPEAIQRFIPEHHGTAEITYFLDRARKQGDKSLRREDFCYPGPRPRTAETAVTMLADSIEAALRVLNEVTPAKLEAAIEKMVRDRLLSGQLDEA
ncbi:MAG TPA: HDIG domain-containing protein, partial [Gemmatimonadales bacterium]|nr:HDIG domain-containing protein [Gemmatimonadales bacterium]